jgi:hypothetical protein
MRVTAFLPNLPAAVARNVFATLTATLPPPVTDTPENRAARDEAAIAAVAALYPADALEALLAAQIVAANAHALDCLRLAAQPGMDAGSARRWRARAAGMMRQMESGLHILRRGQAAREKAEAAMHPAAMARAGCWVRKVSVPGSAEPDPASDLGAEAEQYAVIHPPRAARIRALGGLPVKLDFVRPRQSW